MNKSGLRGDISHDIFPMPEESMLRSMIFFAALSIFAARSEAALLVDNFEASGKTNLQGGVWSTFHDSLSSTVSWTHAATPGAGDSGHCGRMEDSISGSSGYAGVLTALSPDWKSVDLSAYVGVRLWARSNAAIFRLQLPITATNTVYNHYTKELSVDTTWRLFEVPFETLRVFGRLFGLSQTFTVDPMAS